MIRATIKADSHITHTMSFVQLCTQIMHSSSTRIVRIYHPIALLLTNFCFFYVSGGPIRPPPCFLFNFYLALVHFRAKQDVEMMMMYHTHPSCRYADATAPKQPFQPSRSLLLPSIRECFVFTATASSFLVKFRVLRIQLSYTNMGFSPRNCLFNTAHSILPHRVLAHDRSASCLCSSASTAPIHHPPAFRDHARSRHDTIVVVDKLRNDNFQWAK